MQYRLRSITLALALAAPISAVHADQRQQFGRDSLYAVPGTSSSNVTTQADTARAGRDSVYATRAQDPSAAGSITMGGSTPRFGRDSTYATQMPEPSAPVSANGPQLQRFGRDSVYAGPFSSGIAPGNSTAVDTTAPKGNGG